MPKISLNLFSKNPKNLYSAETRKRYGIFSSIVGIILNLLLCIAKLILGSMANSITVMADAFTNLLDAGISLLMFASFKFAAKAADCYHPFGYGRIEYLSGIIIAFFILLTGWEIGKSSLEKLINPEPVNYHTVVVVGLIISILIKIWLGFFFRTLGKRIGSATLKAAAAENILDVYISMAALLSIFAARFTVFPIDGVMGIAIAAIVLFNGYHTLKDTFGPLLGKRADPELAKKIEEIITLYSCILGIHDLTIHDYGPNKKIGSLYAEVPAHLTVAAVHNIIKRAQLDIQQKLHIEIIIYPDPIDTGNKKTK